MSSPSWASLPPFPIYPSRSSQHRAGLPVLYSSFPLALCFTYHLVAKWCVTLCDPMNCSMPGFPVFHYFPEFAQTHVHWVSDAIQPSHPLLPLLLLLSIFLRSESFPMSQLFTSSGRRVEASASASVLPMNIQGWYLLGLTSLISLLSKGFSSVFSSTTVQKHQFFRTHPSLWSNSHIHTWLLEKP